MKVAFIVDEFPSLSTTFILDQITGLLDRGCEVKIFSKIRLEEKIVHKDVKKYHLLERVYYFDVPKNKIKRTLKAGYLLLVNFHRDPIKIIKALNVFKYSKLPETLSLTYIYTLIPFLKEKFDIIHCQFGTNGNIGAVLKQLGIQAKLLATFLGYDIRLGLREGGNIYRRLFKTGDCLMPISQFVYKTLAELGANPKKMTIHPSGIDINKFSFKENPDGISVPDRIIILSVARLKEVKGLQYGIKAVYQLKKKKPGLQLEYRIIGGGPLDRKLKKLVKDLNLTDVVYFLGPMEQQGVIRNLKEAHIFLLPSLAEILGGVTMEAQAVGLPVVASSVGALSEVIIDGESGFLVPPKDVNALAEKLEHLIDHPEIWSNMGQAGRKHVIENYNIHNLNNQLKNIYQKLLETHIQT